MELKEVTKKIPMKELVAEAKKRNIPTRCVTKEELIKKLPKEVIEALAQKK